MDNEKTRLLVPRITQLDASEFDKEIHNLLKNSILEIRRYLRPGFLDGVKSEIELFIQLIVFKYSLLKSNSTFGQQLLNLQYNTVLTSKKACGFCILNYLIPYLKEKYEDVTLNWNNNDMRKVIDKIEVLVKICQFLNLLVFLKQGTFPTLVDRILGLKFVSKSRLNRNVGYNYMTRELIWHGFMELFMYVLPLIRYQNLKEKLFNVFSLKSKEPKGLKSATYQTNTLCSACGELPIYPCRISRYCEHIACYYCIKSSVLANGFYICSSCGVKTTAETDVDVSKYQW